MWHIIHDESITANENLSIWMREGKGDQEILFEKNNQGLEGKQLLAAVADDAAEQGLGDWDFLEGNTIALSAVEINEDGTEGESFEINQGL